MEIQSTYTRVASLNAGAGEEKKKRGFCEAGKHRQVHGGVNHIQLIKVDKQYKVLTNKALHIDRSEA